MENTKTQKIVNITAISLLVYIAFIKGSKLDPMNFLFSKPVQPPAAQMSKPENKVVKNAAPGYSTKE